MLKLIALRYQKPSLERQQRKDGPRRQWIGFSAAVSLPRNVIDRHQISFPGVAFQGFS